MFKDQTYKSIERIIQQPFLQVDYDYEKRFSAQSRLRQAKTVCGTLISREKMFNIYEQVVHCRNLRVNEFSFGNMLTKCEFVLSAQYA